MDISEKIVKEAEKRFPEKKFVEGSALSIPFPENHFDKVYAIALLHHIPSKSYRKKALFEMRRVLKPGGTLFITVWKKERKGLLWKHIFRKVFSSLDIYDIFVPFNGRKRYYHLFKEGDVSSLAGPFFEKVKEGTTKEGKRENIYLIAQK